MPWPLQRRLWPTIQGDGIQTSMMVGTPLASTLETQGEVVEGQQYNHTSSSAKNHRQRNKKLKEISTIIHSEHLKTFEKPLNVLILTVL